MSLRGLEMTLPVALVLLIGILLRTRKIVPREGMQTLKTIAVNVTLPAVLLRAFATSSFTVQNIVIPLAMFAVCVAAYFAGKLAAKLLRMPSPFVPFLTTGFEAGMLGYTLYEMLYGVENIASFAIVDLGQVLFVFTVFKLLLGHLHDEQSQRKPGKIFVEMVRSPIIIAIVTGIVIGATGLYDALKPSGISGLFDVAAQFVAAPTSVLILLVVGYDLTIKGVEWGSVGKIILLRLVLMLLLLLPTVWAFETFLGIPETVKGAVYLMFLLPPPFVLPAFADDANERGNVASVLSVYTLVTIAGFFVLTALAG